MAGRLVQPGTPCRPLYWLLAGIGFARLTVIDAAGAAAHSTVRLSPPP